MKIWREPIILQGKRFCVNLRRNKFEFDYKFAGAVVGFGRAYNRVVGYKSVACIAFYDNRSRTRALFGSENF